VAGLKQKLQAAAVSALLAAYLFLAFSFDDPEAKDTPINKI
jgi:hypothetical protein